MQSIFKYAILLFAIGYIFSSCKKKDEKVVDVGELTFSQDTVFFDTTVFTGIKTITKRVKVFNPSKNAVNVSEISIPDNSPFSLIIDGRKTNALFNKTIRGEDFLLILIEAELEENNEDTILIVEERINFLTNGNQQQIVLVAPGLDVYFHNDEVLSCNEIWRNDHPHVIYNSVWVPEGCKLRIQEGTHIFSHSRSAIFVEGTLEAVGTPTERIIFTDDRLESEYNEIYGVWEGILFLNGSNNNVLDWVHISNSVNGLYINTESANDGNVDVLLAHSIINSIGNNSNAPSLSVQDFGLYTGYGVFSANSDVVIHNSLIENCTVGSVLLILNGDHALANNTLANYSVNGYNRPKDVRSLYASSVVFNAAGAIANAGTMSLLCYNNIVYGENSDPEEENNLDEVSLIVSNANWIFNNNIMKIGDSSIASVVNAGSANILNTTPFDYLEFDPEEDDFELRSGSVAIGVGIAQTISGISDMDIDLNGENRGTSNWDVGAYKFVP